MRRAHWWCAWWLAAFASASAPAPAATLRFIVPSGATSESSRLYSNLIQEFEKEEPGIQVEFKPLQSWDEVVGAIGAPAAHRKATVFVAEVSETLELEKLELIEPFEELLAQFGNLKTFLAPLTPEFLGNSYCRNGKFCAPPFVRSTPVALYNLDRLKPVGVTADNLPATWIEMEAMLSKLQRQTHQPPFCFGGDWYDYLFEATVRQSGGALMDAARGEVRLETPEAVEALAFWKRLKDKNLLIRVNTWKATLNAFVAGFCPVTYYSSGGMQSVHEHARFAWMAEMLPRNRAYGVAVGGGNLYVAAGMNDDERKASLKLAAFLYRPSVQARISAATGFFPVVGAAFAEPALSERYTRDQSFLRVRRQLKFAKPKLMSTDNLQVRNILKKAIDRVLDGGVAPDVALRGAQQEVNRLLGQSPLN